MIDIKALFFFKEYGSLHRQVEVLWFCCQAVWAEVKLFARWDCSSLHEGGTLDKMNSLKRDWYQSTFLFQGIWKPPQTGRSFVVLLSSCLSWGETFCSLLVAHYFLLVGRYFLLVARCSLLFARCLLLVTFCSLLVTFCSLLVIFCLLLVTFCSLLVTFYLLLEKKFWRIFF